MPQSLNDKTACEQRNSEELALLVKIRLGDRQAFSELYSLYQPRLYGYIARTIGHTELVEEVLDDVMFVVWKDCRRFRGDSRLSTWIFGIAYRKSMKAIRNELRLQSRHDSAVDPDDIGVHSAIPDSAVERAVRQLSAAHRQVVVLAYYGGFGYKEIAKIAGCPVNTVKTRMYYARRALQTLLDDGHCGAEGSS